MLIILLGVMRRNRFHGYYFVDRVYHSLTMCDEDEQNSTAFAIADNTVNNVCLGYCIESRCGFV